MIVRTFLLVIKKLMFLIKAFWRRMNSQTIKLKKGVAVPITLPTTSSSTALRKCSVQRYKNK
jgi:hypothetical protein